MTIAPLFTHRLIWLLATVLLLAAPGLQAQEVVYYHTDALGSVVAVTDQNRNVVEKSEYEPFGFVSNHPPQDGPGYTGHVTDAQTGLSYMQQRYYDLGIGRNLSVDPVTAYGSGDYRYFNRYAYAFNNPYKFTDPDGRCPSCIGGIIGGIVGGVGGAVVTAISGGSRREILASAVGGAVGGAFTGATLGAGASQGALIAAGVTAGILGEGVAETVENAGKHGGDLSSYEYSPGRLTVGAVTGPLSTMTGGLVDDVAGAALKKATKVAVTEGSLLPIKTVTEIAVRNHEQKPPPPSPPPPPPQDPERNQKQEAR